MRASVFLRRLSPPRLCTSRQYTIARPIEPLTLSCSSPLIDHTQCPPSRLSSLCIPPTDFLLYPSFLSQNEHDILLESAVKRLDASGSAEDRQARKKYKREHGLVKAKGLLSDEAYGFSDAHFDQVITGYRETTCLEWPSTSPEGLADILQRIYALLPLPYTPSTGLKTPSELIAHVLHLASHGHISPHLDNLDASGTLIAGISLHSERSLHLRYGEHDVVRVRLPPGSVYVQRDSMRYTFEHAVPRVDHWDGQEVGGQPRISVMLRDRKRQQS